MRPSPDERRSARSKRDITDLEQPGVNEVDVNLLAEERPAEDQDASLKAILEAIVYVTDEPLSAQQMAAALGQPLDRVKRLLDELVAEFSKPEHGLSLREIAGGYRMATK